MTRPAKRPRTKKGSDQNPNQASVDSELPRFDDDEPLGVLPDSYEEHESSDSSPPPGESSVKLPPITMGTDSTKPTIFDKLPWKKVKLPNFISDGLSFDADGALLGFEELDGSIWEDLKKKSIPARNLDGVQTNPNDQGEVDHQLIDLEPITQDHHDHQPIQSSQVQDSPKVISSQSTKTIDQRLRKQAKKERLTKSRQAKLEAKSNRVRSTTDPPLVCEAQKDNQPRLSSNGADDELKNVDWAAAAELDGLSDMEGDLDDQWIATPFNESLLQAWSLLKLAAPIKRALHRLSFTKPTPVQQASLPISLCSDPPRDLVVIAETGSGKTLAYALPILNSLILSTPPSSRSNLQSLPIVSLVLTPTRELCLQVKSHIETFLKAMCDDHIQLSNTHNGDPSTLPKNRTGITVVSICGGIAIAKQRKQLERSKRLMEEPGKGGLGCIVIATPGRLWDMIQSWDEFAEGIRHRLDWLIIDEADKMIERGHFEEIQKIIKLTKRPNPSPRYVRAGDLNKGNNSEMEESKDGWVDAETNHQSLVKEDIRTMVFSATMDRNLQINLKKVKSLEKAINNDSRSQTDPLRDLLEQVDFRDPQPEVIDLTPRGRMVSGLKECKIECVLKDKDLYLLHFLLRYTGRTIIFLSSISALRRLSPILALLLPSFKILTLHSEMVQRSRLKSLDSFRSNSNSILLSTDVAARGLDIPQVDHVIHYQIPRTTDSYVHRSGRTARAGKPGVALALIAPDELKTWRNLMKNLGRVDDLPSPPIEYSISNKLKELIELAKKIDSLEHRSSKRSHELNWMKKTAELLEIDLDDETDDDNSDKNNDRKGKKSSEENRRNQELKLMKLKLKERLKDPLIIKNQSLISLKRKPTDDRSDHPNHLAAPHHKINRNINHCFIKDSNLIQTFLSNQNHNHFIGLNSSVTALNDLSPS